MLTAHNCFPLWALRKATSPKVTPPPWQLVSKDWSALGPQSPPSLLVSVWNISEAPSQTFCSALHRVWSLQCPPPQTPRLPHSPEGGVSEDASCTQVSLSESIPRKPDLRKYSVRKPTGRRWRAGWSFGPQTDTRILKHPASATDRQWCLGNVYPCPQL